MKIRWWVCAVLLPMAAAAPAEGPRDDRYWAQWRGPLDTGVATKADPPEEWSETRNIKWKIPLPGQGHSSPIVWEDRIYLTAAIPHGEPMEPPVGVRPGAHDNILKVRKTKFVVIAINRANGKTTWQKTVRFSVPHESRHDTGSYASASPVTDGERIYAFFGSNGLFALDRDGEIVWEKDLGDMHSKHGHGEGASPALFGDTLVVNWDHEGPSFVAAFDKRTGDERWRKERDEPTSWSSPHVVVHEGKPQVVISAANRIRSYDLASGKLLWECGGLSHNVVAGPVSADGMVICASSYEKQAILGITLKGAKGDLTGTDHVAWIKRRDTPYVPSLLLYQGHVYFHRHYQAVLSCLEAKTGKEVYARARLTGIRNVYASPVAAQGRIYITSLEGITLVFSAGANPEALSQNVLDDSFSASAALVGKEFILRGDKSLYCITETK
ncbi:MAG: PQQ-binding-like beta-propeller repeat protein [Roseibacillus sp.]